MGNLPSKNWNDVSMEGWENVTGTELVEKYAEKHRGCYGCFFHCDHFYRVKEGKYKGIAGPGLEYESTKQTIGSVIKESYSESRQFLLKPGMRCAPKLGDDLAIVFLPKIIESEGETLP